MIRISVAAKVLRVIVAILVFIGVAIVLLRIYVLAQPVLPTNAFDAAYSGHTALTLLHIIPGLVFVILGPLQFIAKIRRKYLTFHRWSGRVYVACGVVVGISALILSFVVGFAGLTGAAAIVFFSPLFLISLGLAVYRIRHREVVAHREWMIRAFALGLAITTIRPMVTILIALTGHPFSEVIGICFWLGFSLHLVIAELWINITRAHSSTKNARQ